MIPEIKDGLFASSHTGVLLGTLDRHVPCQMLQTWCIGTPRDAVDVVIPSDEVIRKAMTSRLVVHRFDLIDWVVRTQEPFQIPGVVIAAVPLPTESGLDYLPRDTCPIQDVVSATLAVAREIRSDPLAQFLRRVLEDRIVCSRYWTMPASGRHHHAFAGGLAQHSLEVAQDIASQGTLTEVERDLGIAGGLLHDIGKVWSYTADMFLNERGRAIGHELVGLTQLEPELRVLESEWPDGANAMRGVLSGSTRPRVDGSLPSALVARIRACDQRSCEREKRHPNRSGRSWIPAPWQSSRSTDTRK